MDAQLLTELQKLLGAENVLHKKEDLLLYEYDGSVEVARPDCVVSRRILSRLWRWLRWRTVSRRHLWDAELERGFPAGPWRGRAESLPFFPG